MTIWFQERKIQAKSVQPKKLFLCGPAIPFSLKREIRLLSLGTVFLALQHHSCEINQVHEIFMKAMKIKSPLESQPTKADEGVRAKPKPDYFISPGSSSLPFSSLVPH